VLGVDLNATYYADNFSGGNETGFDVMNLNYRLLRLL
jgi:hypothetical protein